jgi:two-component system chemotaxis response regulator CheY
MAKIMIVDDAAFMRMMLRTILEEAGHQVLVEAADGQEAVGRYLAYRPDMVTMDITMPVMEGIESLQEILKADPSAKVVMCSAMGQKQQIIKAIQMGAKDFIVKPFQKERVLEAVDRVLLTSVR